MKSVVLLSAGLDSTVNFYSAIKAGQVLLALTFDYGQKAAVKEIQSAASITEKFKIPHKVVTLSFFKDLGKSSLLDASQKVPQGEQVQIDDFETSQKTAKSVWVPNRNGIFLNIAAGFAEALVADAIVPGFNKEEAQTFPDNSAEFLQATTASFKYSTSNQVKVHCFTTDLSKTEIVKLGLGLNVDYSQIWPCYHSFEKWCGQCESCLRSKRALLINNVNVKEWFLK